MTMTIPSGRTGGGKASSLGTPLPGSMTDADSFVELIGPEKTLP